MRGLASLCLLCVLGLLAPPAPAEPAAWRVTDGRGELLLLGSVHYLREADYPLPAIVESLYARSDALVMELDMDDLDPLAIQTELLGAAMLPPGSGLADVLGPAVYRRAERRAAEIGVELGLFARFEPWLVAITLMDLGMREAGYLAERGLEQHLLGAAADDDKPVHGLETLASQVRIFDELPPEQQQAMLDQTLAELEDAGTAMAELVGAWRDGSLDALQGELVQDFADFPGLYEALVAERNAAWLPVLEGFLEESETFLVVVGALHLVGEDSVVELLEARGYTVERL